MRAAVVHEFGKPLTIDEVAIPTPVHGEIVLKIAASGVCHTDLHAAEGDWPVKPHLPFIPGHEGVGFVSDVGSGVTRVKEGDRVGVPWLHAACGHCEYCVTGWETLCERRITVRGSIVETRQDLEEALTFAAEGKVHAHVHPGRLEDINTIFERLRQGAIEGRVVLNLQ